MRLKIGAEDMAFPRINKATFRTKEQTGLLMLAGFFVEGGSAAPGYPSYAALTARSNLRGVDLRQIFWCVSLIVLGLSSIMGSINYITTVINLRAPGMIWFRLPLCVWALFVTACLVLLAILVLSGAAILLLFDQTLGTKF